MVKHIQLGRVCSYDNTCLDLDLGRYFDFITISKRSKLVKKLKLKIGDNIKLTFEKVK